MAIGEVAVASVDQKGYITKLIVEDKFSEAGIRATRTLYLSLAVCTLMCIFLLGNTLVESFFSSYHHVYLLYLHIIGAHYQLDEAKTLFLAVPEGHVQSVEFLRSIDCLITKLLTERAPVTLAFSYCVLLVIIGTFLLFIHTPRCVGGLAVARFINTCKFFFDYILHSYVSRNTRHGKSAIFLADATQGGEWFMDKKKE